MNDKFEVSPKFRKVCMLSSAFLSLVTITYDFMKPVEVALGLVVDLTENERSVCQKQLTYAVEEAANRAAKVAKTASQKDIWRELSTSIDEPQNLGQLIEKTEAYQRLYCTRLDAKAMTLTFEKFFKEEIAQYEELSHLYIMSANTITLEYLKVIDNTLHSVMEKVDSANSGINNIERMLKYFESICKKCLNEMVFILIAMAVFLGNAIFIFERYDKSVVFIVLICYTISNFLIFYLKQENKRLKFVDNRDNFLKLVADKKINIKIQKIVVTIVIPIMTTVSIFWLIIFATDTYTVNLLQTTGALVIGNMISIFFKELQLT